MTCVKLKKELSSDGLTMSVVFIILAGGGHNTRARLGDTTCSAVEGAGCKMRACTMVTIGTGSHTLGCKGWVAGVIVTFTVTITAITAVGTSGDGSLHRS
ncbi:hypothetical protein YASMINEVIRUS_513 [Yasminevirus sp. GU-2018]|uniref:Uncharacterized protein n=1 Tax=Yasminevirus sp. GU-2018 TaxID=2420051 RepID=A0A5K0U8A7_9VIRU|nr:hypothetical protein YASMINEVIRUS_513 [Yasminevirus sp. GU-2018]